MSVYETDDQESTTDLECDTCVVGKNALITLDTSPSHRIR